MAISDLLNRRVRALPEEDEEIYSEESAFEEKSDDGRSDESVSSDSDDLDDAALEETDGNVRFRFPTFWSP